MELKIRDNLAMRKKLIIYWVDDDLNRKRRVNSINQYKLLGIPRASVKFIDASNKKFSDLINEIIKEGEPDLLLIDHFLDLIDNDSAEGISKGSTIAQIIKVSWPSCPIVGVTGAEKKSRINWRGKSIYDDLFEVDSLRNEYSALFIIAYYYKLLSVKKPRDKKGILALVDPPEDDIEQLLSIMPDFSIRKDLSQISSVYKWIRFKLMDNPGFLLERIWVATALGIKETSFHKVEKLFKLAEYKGIFSNPDKPKWWSSRIKKILYQKVKDESLKMTWELGHRLPNVVSRDHVKCYCCEEKYPEIVAFTDTTYEKAEPMHLRCTYDDPADKKKLYFYERRVMNEEN